MKVTSILIPAAFFAGACADFGSNPGPQAVSPPPPPLSPQHLIEDYIPVPSPAQLAWEQAGTAMFLHFGMNTMTDRELGRGHESPMYFNPDRLDASQWTDVASKSGFTSMVLTVKHLDGFCLWPSRYTDYSVRNSPFRGGHGDVVRELADACRSAGLHFGFYLSPADRHESTYGSPAYNTFFVNQLTELLTQYGEIGEVWFDGANGEQLTGVKQEYNWDLYFATVRKYQPHALIACVGPDIRWIGNERGVGKVTEWSPQPSSANGPAGGMTWYPSECDVSIRPGWFYHRSEDIRVKSVTELVTIYLLTVGRNSNLILNIPPDRHGLISDVDASALLSWRLRLNRDFAEDLLLHKSIQSSNTRDGSGEFSPANCVDDDPETFWAADQGILSGSLTVDMGSAQTLNAVKLGEAIRYGQRISGFTLSAEISGNWVTIASGTTVGSTRILTFAPVTARRLRISIDSSRAAPTLTTFSAYLISP